MGCPRCNKSHSNEINFYLKPQRIKLQAQVCRVCGYIHAEDEDMLKAIRKHLHYISQLNVQGKKLGDKIDDDERINS